MILLYATHKKIIFDKPGMEIIATKSPIAYRDFVQGFRKQNNLVTMMDDDYCELDIAKACDFIGDPLLSYKPVEQFKNDVIGHFVKEMDDTSRDKLLKAFNQLNNTLQDALLLEELPLEISFDEDIKKFLHFENIHFDQHLLKDPYDIIEMILRIHQQCQLDSVPVICNLSHYIEKEQFIELNKLIKQMKQELILIEFTDNKFSYVSKDVDYYYIDEDLVDWY